MLMDCLIVSKTRVIVLSSKLHEYYTPKDGTFSNIELFLNNDGSLLAENMYSRSKFANVLFTKKLDRIFKEQDSSADRAICVCVHPGLVKTNIVKSSEMSFTLFIVNKIMAIFSKDCIHGAQTTLHCAFLERSKLKGGSYYAECEERASNPLTLLEQTQDDLWKISVSLYQKYL